MYYYNLQGDYTLETMMDMWCFWKAAINSPDPPTVQVVPETYVALPLSCQVADPSGMGIDSGSNH